MTDLARIPWKGLAVLLACVVAGRSLVAQEPATAPAPPAASAPADPPPKGADAPAVDAPAVDAPAAAADDETGTAERAKRPAAATGSPQRFEPSERVRPDFDVVFPIDI